MHEPFLFQVWTGIAEAGENNFDLREENNSNNN